MLSVFVMSALFQEFQPPVWSLPLPHHCQSVAVVFCFLQLVSAVPDQRRVIMQRQEGETKRERKKKGKVTVPYGQYQLVDEVAATRQRTSVVSKSAGTRATVSPAHTIANQADDGALSPSFNPPPGLPRFHLPKTKTKHPGPALGSGRTYL